MAIASKFADSITGMIALTFVAVVMFCDVFRVLARLYSHYLGTFHCYIIPSYTDDCLAGKIGDLTNGENDLVTFLTKVSIVLPFAGFVWYRLRFSMVHYVDTPRAVFIAVIQIIVAYIYFSEVLYCEGNQDLCGPRWQEFALGRVFLVASVPTLFFEALSFYFSDD